MHPYPKDDLNWRWTAVRILADSPPEKLPPYTDRWIARGYRYLVDSENNPGLDRIPTLAYRHKEVYRAVQLHNSPNQEKAYLEAMLPGQSHH